MSCEHPRQRWSHNEELGEMPCAKCSPGWVWISHASSVTKDANGQWQHDGIRYRRVSDDGEWRWERIELRSMSPREVSQH